MKPDSSTADALRASLNTTFLVGGGEMGALIRAYDWSSTAIGAPENWPQGLKTAIRIMLTSRQPIWIGWGDELLFFYNDPYKSIVGGKHPVALGQPTAVVWHEIWDEIEPLLDAALTGDEGIFVEQKLLIMERNGFPEETYYTFSYSPVPTDDGTPGGMICANSDDTSRVIGERQLMLLRELAASTADTRFWRDVCEASARALATNPRDLPFALLYVAEPGGTEVTLAGASGITPGHPAAPAAMHAALDPCWPFTEVLRTQSPMLVTDLAQRFGAGLPGGAWTLEPRQAVILPVTTGGEAARAGVLVVALNPCRLFDESYRGFLNLVAGQIGAAIAYAHAYEEERRRAEALAEVDRATQGEAELDEPQALLDAEGPAHTADPAGNRSSATMTGRVMVVDDNADLRDYMRRILRQAGHSVTVAVDGEAALKAAREAPPDLIVSDVMMPRLDGFGLLRALRNDPLLCETPVLLLSARAGEEARVGGLESGADDYLTKPFSARELLARVSGNLHLARLRRDTERTLREESRTLEILNRVGKTVAAELDLSRAVQIVTDAATELTGAALGSFFYNVKDKSDDQGGSYRLYTLSGAPKETFAAFPMPRNTSLFGPTFKGESIVRIDDVTKDARYGKSAPHHGMPPGHPPVRSYLAAPVVSRTGEVLGGLFFGHPQAGVFDARAERIVVGIAAQAAIAIDNARLYQAAQSEIVERTRAEGALRELNETLEQRVAEAVADRDRLWELSEDLLAVGDFDGNLQRISPSWSAALGYSKHWLLAHSYLELLHPDDIEIVTAHLERLRRTGVPVRYETRLRRIDGAWRWVAWTVSLDPASERIHGVGRDVTADRETTEALQHAEEALRIAQKMESIGKLTGGVAHDFNNLLQVIGGNLQLLAKDVAGDEVAGQRVRNALAGVARGANLASQLLAFGRRQPLAPKVVNLGRFIRGLDDMFRRALGDGIEIETVVSGGLWNTLVDPFQVENALLNLAINARDAMMGHGRLTMEAGNASLDDTYAQRNVDVSAGQYVMVALTDTGSGMPPEVRERAFEPFFTTKPEGQGTGLGLSMVYGFVKQSGGHVKIYSEPGEGTTVRLYLPRVRQEEDRETRVDAGPFKGGAETVLVVEDDEDVRSTVVEMLSDLGYRVLKAKDAQSALAIVESGVPIHLLFTDVVMPGPLRSTELARKARERLPEVAVLFTSGYTDNAIVHAGRLDEGIELLSKPYTYEALARKVRHVMRLQGGERADEARVEHEDPAAAAVKVALETTVVDAEGVTSAAETRLRILYVEDDELVRLSTADLLRTFGVSVLEAENEAQALRLLSEEPVDVLLTDVGLAGRSGVELAIDACRFQPHLPVVFLSGYDLVLTPAQQAALPEATSLRKPYDPLALVNLLMRHVR